MWIFFYACDACGCLREVGVRNNTNSKVMIAVLARQMYRVCVRLCAVERARRDTCLTYVKWREWFSPSENVHLWLHRICVIMKQSDDDVGKYLYLGQKLLRHKWIHLKTKITASLFHDVINGGIEDCFSYRLRWRSIRVFNFPFTFLLNGTAFSSDIICHHLFKFNLNTHINNNK